MTDAGITAAVRGIERFQLLISGQRTDASQRRIEALYAELRAMGVSDDQLRGI